MVMRGTELKRQNKLGNKRVKLSEEEWELRNPNHFRGAKEPTGR